MRTNIQQEWTSIGRLVDALPAFSDHDHHQPDAFFREPMTLDRLFSNSYVAWTGYAPDGSDASRRALLDNARFNSYFTWLERGIQTVHGIQEPIRLDNWESVSATVKAAYAADPHFHWQVLRRHGYERLLLDTYWSGIGGDNGHPEIFTPVFRIDKFMYGTHAEAVAPNDIVPWKAYGFSGGSLDDYVDRMNAVITEQQGAGRVAALKCAEAYNRSIDFLPDDRAAAESAFGKHPDDLTDRQKTCSRIIFSTGPVN